MKVIDPMFRIIARGIMGGTPLLNVPEYITEAIVRDFIAKCLARTATLAEMNTSATGTTKVHLELIFPCFYGEDGLSPEDPKDPTWVKN